MKMIIYLKAKSNDDVKNIFENSIGKNNSQFSMQKYENDLFKNYNIKKRM